MLEWGFIIGGWGGFAVVANEGSWRFFGISEANPPLVSVELNPPMTPIEHRFVLPTGEPPKKKHALNPSSSRLSRDQGTSGC